MRGKGGDGCDYTSVPLRDVLVSPPRNGLSPSALPEQTGVYSLGLGCLTVNGFSPRQLKNMPADLRSIERYTLNDGDLLMSRANTRDLVGLAGRYKDIGSLCIYPDLMMRLQPDESRCLAAYLELVLRSTSIRRFIKAGARGTNESMVKITARLVGDLCIPLPPAAEQRRIVDVVAAVSRDIEALERRIDKLQVLCDAAIYSTASNSASVVGGGEVRRQSLGACFLRIEAGKSPAADSLPAGPGEWGVLKVSAVRRGWFDGRENKAVRDAELVNPSFEVKSGDLLMTRANTEELLGLACIARNPVPKLMLSDKTLRLVYRPDVADPEYLELALAFPEVRHQIQAVATGTSGSMKNIGQDKIRDLRIILPSLDGQRRVVMTAERAKRRIAVTEARAEKLRVVRDALAEDLLSGRVRVSDL